MISVNSNAKLSDAIVLMNFIRAVNELEINNSFEIETSSETCISFAYPDESDKLFTIRFKGTYTDNKPNLEINLNAWELICYIDDLLKVKNEYNLSLMINDEPLDGDIDLEHIINVARWDLRYGDEQIISFLDTIILNKLFSVDNLEKANTIKFDLLNTILKQKNRNKKTTS